MGFGVFTAGQVGRNLIEEDRFGREEALRTRGLDIQEQGLGLQERQVGVQEQQAATQASQLKLENEADLRTFALEQTKRFVGLEAFSRFSAARGQPTQGLAEYAQQMEPFMKAAKISKDQFEIMVLQEMARLEQEQAAAESERMVELGQTERLVDPLTGEETVPAQTADKPTSESQVIGGILQEMITLPKGFADLDPQKKQVLAFKLAQNPLGQFALGENMSMAELMGSSFFQNMPASDEAYVTTALGQIQTGQSTPEQVLEHLQGQNINEERKRAIATALGLAMPE